MTPAQLLAARIRAHPIAFAEAKAGRNGHLLEALNTGRPDLVPETMETDLNSALILIKESHYARYMNNEFVDPEMAVRHQARKDGEHAAYIEDKHRSVTARAGGSWPMEDDSAARAAAAVREAKHA